MTARVNPADVKRPGLLRRAWAAVSGRADIPEQEAPPALEVKRARRTLSGKRIDPDLSIRDEHARRLAERTAEAAKRKRKRPVRLGRYYVRMQALNLRPTVEVLEEAEPSARYGRRHRRGGQGTKGSLAQAKKTPPSIGTHVAMRHPITGRLVRVPAAAYLEALRRSEGQS